MWLEHNNFQNNIETKLKLYFTHINKKIALANIITIFTTK